MVSKKSMKIAVCVLAVAAVAIGLGAGLITRKNSESREISASQALEVEQCRRLIDGSSDTHEIVDAAKPTPRKLNDGYVPVAKGSAEGGMHIPVCSKGTAANLCGIGTGAAPKAKGSDGPCSCVASTGYKGEPKDPKGLVPIPCGCVNPIPVAPSICLSPSTPNEWGNDAYDPSSPSTPDQWGNDAYNPPSPSTADQWGNDAYNPPSATPITNPPSGGSTPTVSTEVTGPPTVAGRSS